MKITEKRLELLQAIKEGAVCTHYPLDPHAPYICVRFDYSEPLGGKKVTGRVRELERAGLAGQGGKVDGPRYKSPRRWVLTAAGEAVLASHREVSK